MVLEVGIVNAHSLLPNRCLSAKVSATEYRSVRGCEHFQVSLKRTSKSSAIYVTLQLSSVPDAHNVNDLRYQRRISLWKWVLL